MAKGIRPCPKLGKKPPRMKPKRLSDPKHLTMIRQLPCVICLTEHAIVPHHIMQGTTRGWGLKAGDDKTVPICAFHHNMSNDCAHDNRCGSETAWFASKGVLDPLGLAKALYAATGHYGAMLGLIQGARE